MDANEVLTLTCQRLKDEAGRPQDFIYGDLAVVKQAQAGEVRKVAAVSTGGRFRGKQPLHAMVRYLFLVRGLPGKAAGL